MTASELLIAELLALRCSVAALAREILLRNGSDAFVHAEAQAKHFIETATGGPGANPVYTDDVRAKACEAAASIFQMADS